MAVFIHPSVTHSSEMFIPFRVFQSVGYLRQAIYLTDETPTDELPSPPERDVDEAYVLHHAVGHMSATGVHPGEI